MLLLDRPLSKYSIPETKKSLSIDSEGRANVDAKVTNHRVIDEWMTSGRQGCVDGKGTRVVENEEHRPMVVGTFT